MENQTTRKAKNKIRGLLGNRFYCGLKGIYLNNGFFKWIRYHIARIFLSDAGYSKSYYLKNESHNSQYYSLFAETIYLFFRPEKVVDVGCGSGGIGEVFLKLGCSEYVGYDYSKAALRLASERLTRVDHLDITASQRIKETGDICICLEVLEHLPEETADSVVGKLSEVASVLIVSAAQPGQGGYLHLNEKSQEYWVEKFESTGMKFDRDCLMHIREAFGGRMLKDYDQNLMVFTKR